MSGVELCGDRITSSKLTWKEICRGVGWSLIKKEFLTHYSNESDDPSDPADQKNQARLIEKDDKDGRKLVVLYVDRFLLDGTMKEDRKIRSILKQRINNNHQRKYFVHPARAAQRRMPPSEKASDREQAVSSTVGKARSSLSIRIDMWRLNVSS